MLQKFPHAGYKMYWIKICLGRYNMYFFYKKAQYIPNLLGMADIKIEIKMQPS